MHVTRDWVKYIVFKKENSFEEREKREKDKSILVFMPVKHAYF